MILLLGSRPSVIHNMRCGTWRRFKWAVNGKEERQAGAITSISFCATAPHDFAVTASARISLFATAATTTGLSRGMGLNKASFYRKQKQLSRFTDVAYSGMIRADGKLLVAGGEKPAVRVFDLSSRAVLRTMRGHTRSVHATQWSGSLTRIMSGSDDKTARWWDLPTQRCLSVLSGHTDYVRSVCGGIGGNGNGNSEKMDALWATGSYDHTVRVWDMRAQVL